MEYLRIKNWDKWQSYRNDRGTPPWIKVHRRLMTSATWAGLKDHDKGHLICIWIAAADNGGRIPADPSVLRKICGLDQNPDISKFIDLGYLEPNERQHGVNMAPTWRQSDPPETETETETETERAEAPPKKTARRKRLPNTWKLTDKLRTYCKTKRPDLDPDETAEGFINFWLGDGRAKADWDRAFMTWVRNEKFKRTTANGTGETTVQARNRRNREAIKRAQAHDHGGHVAAHE